MSILASPSSAEPLQEDLSGTGNCIKGFCPSWKVFPGTQDVEYSTTGALRVLGLVFTLISVGFVVATSSRNANDCLVFPDSWLMGFSGLRCHIKVCVLSTFVCWWQLCVLCVVRRRRTRVDVVLSSAG